MVKGSLRATFGVDVKRTPYFFKDRAVTLNDKGSRKRIFHIVRAHVRANGSEVKFHFRGERKFTWNGYSVLITVPGIHHHHLSELNVATIDVPEGRSVKGINPTEFAENWKRHIENGEPLGFGIKDGKQVRIN